MLRIPFLDIVWGLGDLPFKVNVCNKPNKASHIGLLSLFLLQENNISLPTAFADTQEVSQDTPWVEFSSGMLRITSRDTSKLPRPHTCCRRPTTDSAQNSQTRSDGTPHGFHHQCLSISPTLQYPHMSEQPT